MQISHILVPADGSVHAARALDIAADLARAHDAKVSLLHILQQDKTLDELRAMPVFERLGKESIERLNEVETVTLAPLTLGAGAVPVIVPDDVLGELGDLVLADAKALLEKRGVRPGTVAKTAGDPAKRILGAAEELAADLIVLGSRGLGSFRGMLYGSTSQKVAHTAKCPVVSVT
ncbi:universal stress protein [Marinivivus vitaminiproducens]|uniref:universal stress protein n=1 Tax=Marinivivus vitaminiproducens TaxID=3035935 RepID=UPI0027A8681C|nr:universal stress protein [Geminicoccaceae bacterium SCSIO 64248]